MVKHKETLRELLTYPVPKLFPCIDLYRIFLLHPQSNVEFTRSDMGSKEMAMLLGFLGEKGAPNAVYMLTLRAMANLFANQASQHVALRRRQQVFDAIAPFLESADKNARLAATTILLK